MNNKYSVDYANKTVRQLPDMERPLRETYSSFITYERAASEYDKLFLKLPTYPCPTMPDSWRERETVELDKDFKLQHQMDSVIHHRVIEGEWIDCSGWEYNQRGSLSRRIIAIPIPETENCDECNGKGEREQNISYDGIISADVPVNCMYCNGTGIAPKQEAEVKNEKPDEGGSILKEALEEIIHTSASKAYTPFQKVNRIFQIAASALQTPQPNK